MGTSGNVYRTIWKESKIEREFPINLWEFEWEGGSKEEKKE